jgi:hypothetical protein
VCPCLVGVYVDVGVSIYYEIVRVPCAGIILINY